MVGGGHMDRLWEGLRGGTHTSEEGGVCVLGGASV